MFTKIVAHISESGQVQVYMCTHTLQSGQHREHAWRHSSCCNVTWYTLLLSDDDNFHTLSSLVTSSCAKLNTRLFLMS